jgi:molybdopterin-guanine dinucleotide biosynthesis protein A
MASIPHQQITGLILAGGRGSRMGSVDKGLQPLRGEPMAGHVLRRLAPQVGPLVINANRNLEVYRSFGVPVWPDELDGFAGPLAGLQTGLHRCATPYLATAPCDSPFLPADLVPRLTAALIEDDADLAVATIDETAGGRTVRRQQPVFCLLKVALLAHLNEYLAGGGRKVDAWYSSLRMAEAWFPDDTAFRNINTPEDLRRFETSSPI